VKPVTYHHSIWKSGWAPKSREKLNARGKPKLRLANIELALRLALAHIAIPGAPTAKPRAERMAFLRVVEL